jgi:hypothetical protein
MADNLGREPIPGVAGASGCPHPTQLPIPIRWRNRGKARQVDGAIDAIRQLAVTTPIGSVHLLGSAAAAAAVCCRSGRMLPRPRSAPRGLCSRTRSRELRLTYLIRNRCRQCIRSGRWTMCWRRRTSDMSGKIFTERSITTSWPVFRHGLTSGRLRSRNDFGAIADQRSIGRRGGVIGEQRAE